MTRTGRRLLRHPDAARSTSRAPPPHADAAPTLRPAASAIGEPGASPSRRRGSPAAWGLAGAAPSTAASRHARPEPQPRSRPRAVGRRPSPGTGIDGPDRRGDRRDRRRRSRRGSAPIAEQAKLSSIGAVVSSDLIQQAVAADHRSARSGSCSGSRSGSAT